MIMTYIFNRDRRLLLAGLIGVALLWCGFMFHFYWSAFIQWCLGLQITLHRYLVMYLLQVNNHQYDGGLWLLTGSFLYGVLHAVGPGHGKFIVTTYLSTHKESLLTARTVPFIGSMLQGVSAIVFVFILAVGLNLASADLSSSRWYVEKISALLIGSFGVYVIYQGLKKLPTYTSLASQGKHADDCACGHHGVGHDMTDSNWKTRAGMVLAIGSRPCSGAIMILLFSNVLGIVSWGMAAVMSMSLGTGLSILALSLAVRYARCQIAPMIAIDDNQLKWWFFGVRIAGGLLLLFFAVVLFFTVIPISANGDFIAAGC